MSDNPGWVTAVQWGVWLVVMLLVMGWLAKARLRSRAKADTATLAHPITTLIVGVVCFSFFIGLAILAMTSNSEEATWWVSACFIGFALLAVPVILDFIMARHSLTPEGLHYRKMKGTKKFMKWSDLERVRYASAMKWFVLTAKNGSVARISVMLMGLPEFAQHMLAHAPKEVIDRSTLSILQKTADGSPPSVWG